MTQKYKQKTAGVLRSGGVGIIPTDTIYGIVGSALNKKAVARIYKLRRRDPKKPMIILISDMRQATWDKFGIKPSQATKRLLRKFWPHLRPSFVKTSAGKQGYGGQAGAVSVVLSLSEKRQATRDKWKYLHRGTRTLAFRLPAKKFLRNLLKKTGPLVAPSANWENRPPAKTIREAKKYFKNDVDFYVDGGRLHSRPSTLIKIEKGKVVILRK